MRAFAATIQVQAERDIGLVSLTMNFCGSWHYSALSQDRELLGDRAVSFAHRDGVSWAAKFSARCEDADVAGQPTEAFCG